MTAYNLRNKLFRSTLADRSARVDPGSAGTIYLGGVDHAVVECTGAGTRTLEDAANVGLGTRVLCLSQTAAVVIAGATSETIGDGEFVEFICTNDSAGAHQWVVSASTELQGLTDKVNQTFEDVLDMLKWRVHDAPQTALTAGAGANDDLGLTISTYGTSAPELNYSVDDAAAIQYARQTWKVPQNYVDGTALTLKITVTETAAADTDAGIDANCYRTAAPSVDLNATALQSILGASSTVYSFTLTGTNVVAGETLDLRIFVDADDSGGATAATDYEIEKVSISYTVS